MDRRKRFFRLSVIFSVLFVLASNTGVLAADSPAGETLGKISVFYGCIAAVSVLLPLWYALFDKERDLRLLFLYVCVGLANLGYFLLSVAGTLEFALWANRISYLGSAYLLLFMLLTVMDVCGIQPKKWTVALLFACTTAAFLLAASGGAGRLYYTEVSIERVNGATRLIKEYGPLHFAYSVYLFSYFSMMVALTVIAAVKKGLPSPKYVFFLAAIVSGNICVWLVEQLADTDFEFLSVSYVATEMLLFLLHGILRDYGISGKSAPPAPETVAAPSPELPPNLEELFSEFSRNVTTLTSAEKKILLYYIDGHETADIPSLAFVSIHTVKKHNRSIYQKLGVASKDELMLYIELFRRTDRLRELLDPPCA